MSVERTDQELIDALCRGNPAAAGEIYDRYGRPLYSLCFKIVGNRSDSEEVVQDVFVSLWKNAANIDLRRGKLFTWLVSVMRNRSIDRIRRRQRRIPEAPAGEPDRLPEATDEDTALDALYSHERAETIRRAIRSLPREQQRAIELSFFSGLSHQEIADHLGQSLGTIKSRIRYGLNKLRGTLTEETLS